LELLKKIIMNFLNKMKKQRAKKARKAEIKKENMSRATNTPSKRVDLPDAGTLPEMIVTAKPINYQDVRRGRATAMQYARSRFNRNQRNK